MLTSGSSSSFAVLQVVDGMTLRYAVHNWVSASVPQKTVAFAAAEVARWTETWMNALSYFLAGMTLFLFGLAIALGRIYPPWAGLMAVVAGAAFVCDEAVVVAYEGFVPDIVKLVGLLLLAVWAFVMSALMWRSRWAGAWRRLGARAGNEGRGVDSPGRLSAIHRRECVEGISLLKKLLSPGRRSKRARKQD